MGLMSGAFARGSRDAFHEILAQRMMAEQLRQQQLQQQFENSLRTRQLDQGDALRRDQLAETNRRNTLADEDRNIGLANTLADQLPGGTFLPENDRAVGMLRTGGRGALLQPQDERPAVDVGPLLPGDTGAARPKGFLKTRSAKQLDTEADNERQTAAAAAQRARDEETGRHNRVMESKPAASSTVVVQGPDGPMLVNKGTGTARGVTDASGGQVGPAPTAQERNTKASYGRARPVLEAISGLSEKINTGQGALAKISGAIERQKAKLNLDDDVAEYESMISGFTPLIARALGHTGVLTEQDVQSVKAMFPRPGDSKSLRDRKIQRIEQLMGAIEGNGGAASPAPPSKRIVYDSNGNPVK